MHRRLAGKHRTRGGQDAPRRERRRRRRAGRVRQGQNRGPGGYRRSEDIEGRRQGYELVGERG